MDTLFIEQLSIKTFVGTHPNEQRKKRTIIINLSLNTSIEKAGRSDHLNDTLNYQTIIEDIQTLISSQRFNLLESIAKTISDYLEPYRSIFSAQIEVMKPEVLPNVKCVKITHRVTYSKI